MQAAQATQAQHQAYATQQAQVQQQAQALQQAQAAQQAAMAMLAHQQSRTGAAQQFAQPQPHQPFPPHRRPLPRYSRGKDTSPTLRRTKAMDRPSPTSNPPPRHQKGIHTRTPSGPAHQAPHQANMTSCSPAYLLYQRSSYSPRKRKRGRLPC
jgi:hypothetical protein